ncbi:hypothetical protein PV367_45595, partial [Streptomyces europaeiscabiei]|nr:hypothetical protein [Streptomyces europaeiscabiei]
PQTAPGQEVHHPDQEDGRLPEEVDGPVDSADQEGSGEEGNGQEDDGDQDHGDEDHVDEVRSSKVHGDEDRSSRVHGSEDHREEDPGEEGDIPQTLSLTPPERSA